MRSQAMTTTKTNSFDPWSRIAASRRGDTLAAKYVDPKLNPNQVSIFWSRTLQNQKALLIEYECSCWAPIKLPELKHIEIFDSKENSSIVLLLNDPHMSDVFLNVCVDIINILQEIPKDNIRSKTIARLEKWSHLLSPSRKTLSDEVQKGLISELFFLHNYCVPSLGAESALEGWSGPSGNARDFSYGQTLIEVKSKRNSGSQIIKISSENQLNTNNSETLFLFVTEINSCPIGQGVSLSDVIRTAREDFDAPELRFIFESKIASIGYSDMDDYSATQWSTGESHCYFVAEEFPKIDSAHLPEGVSGVVYDINLEYCRNFRINTECVCAAMEGKWQH